MNKVDVNGLTEREFLAEYKPGDYDRPSVTVDMMVLRMKEDLSCMQVLLIKRKAHPEIPIWNAHYGVASSPIDCALWQGTCTARLPGYKGDMDVNISYIG